MELRLDKYLAHMGEGTRSEVKKAILKGQVLVNKVQVKKPETKVDVQQDEVVCQGRAVVYAEYEYYMLNKPQGVVSATRDKKEQTVVDLIKSRKRDDLFCVGRLDKDTEGLLLITNDGALSHKLLSPKKHVDKVYYARVRGEVLAEDVEAFALGIDIGDEKQTMPALLSILETGSKSQVEVTIQEGRYHQIKRMFTAIGKEVIYLKRLRMGGLCLDDSLEPGEYKRMEKDEIEKLC